ncbi:MAG: hypothetical protein O3A06_12655 [Proteobacteria bacterium]|nr:hypothetical protein [Pseudomonadota bacterium]
MNGGDPLLRLLARLREEGVEYVLVGGQAVRLNGFLRATEDVGVLLRPTRENGERVKRVLDFLASAPDLIADLLFDANGETYESVQPFVRELIVEGVPIRLLNIDGLLRIKTRTREKDLLDRQMLERIQQGLGAED